MLQKRPLGQRQFLFGAVAGVVPRVKARMAETQSTMTLQQTVVASTVVYDANITLTGACVSFSPNKNKQSKTPSAAAAAKFFLSLTGPPLFVAPSSVLTSSPLHSSLYTLLQTLESADWSTHITVPHLRPGACEQTVCDEWYCMNTARSWGDIKNATIVSASGELKNHYLQTHFIIEFKSLLLLYRVQPWSSSKCHQHSNPICTLPR